MRLTIKRIASLQGEMRPPSDKSLTHRAYMFGAIADGQSTVRHPLRGEDCESTLKCLASMGLEYRFSSDHEVILKPAKEWQQPTANLDCGNSGTTMRLLSGLVASRPLDVTMSGDASLSKRPMKRIAEPLRLMGATVEGDRPPIRIVGGELKPIRYASPVASAQVKSCVLLAGLRAAGETWVVEPSLSRDHTERMLRAMGVPLLGEGAEVGVAGGCHLNSFQFDVPADISSAAFFMVAAALVPQSQVTLHDVSINPTRTGILDVFAQCRIPVAADVPLDTLGEPYTSLEVRTATSLQPFAIGGADVPRLIDEIPVLAVLATQCDGESIVRDAGELRVKESDRIALMADGLRAMGADIEGTPDGLIVRGPTPLKGTHIDAQGDHRIAMSFAVAGLIADGETIIDGVESIATSFPDFERELWRLAVV
jgi:3-phosphoshikimate 1-carboxyvinyltransferase